MRSHIHRGAAQNSWRGLVLSAAGIALIVGPPGVDVLNTPQLRAQSSTPAVGSPEFEVASVKANKSGDGRMMLAIQPDGRFTATNVPLRLLIRNSYQVQDFQLVGGPDWIASERFDIVAKAEGDVPPTPPGGPPGPMQLMLRTLLADRFKLVVHHEMRELPVYALVLARSDGRLGSQLRTSSVDCQALTAAARAARPGERPPCGFRTGPGNMSGGAATMSQFANALSTWVQRIVVDRSGLTGNFDVDLTWTPDQMPRGAPPPGAPPLPDPNGPSIFTALQEQLGLKLDSTKSPVDVLVVDRADHPTED